MLIGKGGETRRMLEEASGATIEIDSKSGEVMADWGESEVDPVTVSYTHLRAHET